MSEFWENLQDRDVALDAILTGYKGDTLDMPVYDNVMSKLKHHGSILDFGCGAGRNLKYLVSHYDKVYGYDYPNMLKFVPRETLANKNLYLLDSLDKVLIRRYDEILCSLVLQHIHPTELRSLLEELVLHSSRFIIHSRIWVDFTFEPIAPILADYLNIESIEYQKDPNSDENDHFIGIFIPR